VDGGRKGQRGEGVGIVKEGYGRCREGAGGENGSCGVMQENRGGGRMGEQNEWG